ncbi:MAG: hypothetical protein OEW16_01890 [Gammaproteobacteria bacterium]|nr:hypothetical protein [Gammaproteobacteria bacterium]
MRFVSRTTRSLLEQSREQLLRRRAAAGTLGEAFPYVEQIRVELCFTASESTAPAAQRHALYPPAPAYFEFACPFGDCDGSFDLNGVASPLLKKAKSHVDGTIQCSGSRTRSGMPRQPCSLRADYMITAQYQASSAQKG